jgi:hypothetical protein
MPVFKYEATMYVLALVLCVKSSMHVTPLGTYNGAFEVHYYCCVLINI